VHVFFSIGKWKARILFVKGKGFSMIHGKKEKEEKAVVIPNFACR
jgi:hypothetical protein